MLLEKIGPTGAKVGKKESKSLAIITPTPCSKAKAFGPCNFCALWKKGKSKLPAKIVIKELKEILKDPKNRPPNTERVELLSFGSLIDGIERKTLNKMVEIVASKGYREIVIEARPEHFTEERILELKKIAGESFLRFAFGLDSWDDYVRNDILGKHMAKKEIKKTLKTIKKLNVGAWLYVFMKPLGLDEHMAVSDCLSTIKNCSLEFKDVDIVFAIQPAYIAKGSEFHKRALKMHYMPPFLWSIVHLLEIVHSKKFINEIGRTTPPQIFVGLSDEQFSGGNYVKNCPKCSEKIYKLIDKDYNRSQDVKIFEEVKCECEEDWEDIYTGKKIENYDNTISTWNISHLENVDEFYQKHGEKKK